MSAAPKVRRRDLKEDKVYLTLTDVAAFFVRYRTWIAIGAFAVVLGFAIGYFRHLRAQRTETEAAWAVYQAMNAKAPSPDKLKQAALEYRGTSAGQVASYEAAGILYDEGHYEQALKGFEDFARKYPTHTLAPSAVESAGYCHESLGQWKDAIDTYQSLIKKWPLSPEAKRVNYRLGLCYERTGDKEKAIEAYRKTIELAPGTLWAEYASDHLASLSPTDAALAKASGDEAEMPGGFSITPEQAAQSVGE